MQIHHSAPLQTVQNSAKAGARGSVAKFVAQKADKALGAKTLGQIQKHDYSGLVGLKGQDRLDALADLRRNHPQQYTDMLADVRAGKVEDKGFKLGVGLDRLKDTDFAKSKDGQEIVAHLEQQYAAEQVKSADHKSVGGLGKTDFGGGKATITLSDKLLNSPEGTAAILAHEGMHSLRATTNRRATPLQEETDGNMITGQVWNEFGSQKRDSNSPAIADLDATASYYVEGDDSKMKGHVAGRYAQDYIGKGEWKLAEKTLREYLNDNSRKKGEPLKNIDLKDLESLTRATREVAGRADGEYFLKQADYLESQLSKRQD